MDGMLQNHGAKLVYPLPQGLKELCSDISREVLRSQPEDICTFIADYLDALLITRENAKVAIRIFQEITQESKIYEAIWRRKGLNIEDVTRAAVVIQAAFRGFLVRRSMKMMGVGIDAVLKKLGIDRETATKAAISIQALIRGYYGRKKAKSRKRTLEILEELGITEAMAEAQAIKIQAAWRGYRLRQEIKERGEPLLHKGIVTKEEKDTVELSAGPAALSPDDIRQMAKKIVQSMVNKATGYEPSEAEDIAEDILDKLFSHMFYKKEIPPGAPTEAGEGGGPVEGFDESNISEFIKQELQEYLLKALENKETDKESNASTLSASEMEA